MPGIRAELVFEDAGECPVADASESVPGSVTGVTWGEDEDGTVTEQVTASGDLPEFEPAFDYGNRTVYEFERDAEEPCICEFVELEVGPVSDVHAQDGDLHVTMHVSDVESLREQMGEFRERFGPVRIEYLVQGRTEDDEPEVSPVDLGRLTDRQLEVVKTAYEMGYFEYPRDANATEVAERLGIQPSTFTEHLTAAQDKLLSELVG